MAKTDFPSHFISAGTEYADFDRQVPAPYIRKRFTLEAAPGQAQLLITGLGFYRVFINGKELTKCILAPYLSNPDDIIYYDRYDALPYLTEGENVIGVILGNGMQNAYGGFVWNFDKAGWRSAPMTALRLDIELLNGSKYSVESDDSFLTHPSGLLENELRSGEVYDAGLAIEDWCQPECDETNWKPVITVLPPRGEKRLCAASPIKTYEKRQAVSIIPYKEGYLYDFGIDAAGVCELNIRGTKGQKVHIFYGEWYHDGILDKQNLMFSDYPSPYVDRVQDFCYVCRGQEAESYLPYFSYYGFRYAYVTGIEPSQATRELLTYHVMGGDFQERASFSCSDNTANLLQTMTRRSVLSNFLWIPTDCPHREKNGWTGDIALSAEHILLNLSAEDSLREWLRNVEKSQAADGEFPGIVPTGGWGFGNGPAWDQVIVEIPYCLYRLRGELITAKEAAPHIFRYLFHLSGIRNQRGLIHTGLGDWCETGKSGGGQKAPVEVTGTAIAVDLTGKAMVLFEELHMDTERRYAEELHKELKAAFRKYLIDYDTMTVAGSCQTSQAMAIYYDLFKSGEKTEAVRRLVEMIHKNNDLMNAGALGLRVLFHVLAVHGQADLAYHMITRPDYPSYGNWIERGATALWEDFLTPDREAHSRNHHFFGDISSFFIQRIAGIIPNPNLEGADTVLVAPHFIKQLETAQAVYVTPSGRIKVCWERIIPQEGRDTVRLKLLCEGELTGTIRLPNGWEFEDGFCEKVCGSGVCICRN